mgnify:CR=1 FL=1
MSSFYNRSLISIKDLSKDELVYFLKAVSQFQKFSEKKKQSLLAGRAMASLFFEPSTRTRLSFEAAIQKLGGQVIGFTHGDTTSMSKGESLSDSIKIIGGYADVLVIRHPLEGTARLASEATDKPIINAGDGANEHPSQTLLDLYTIFSTQKKLEGLNVAMVGDLKYGRTVHSLAYALSLFGARLFFVAPKVMQMPEDILSVLRARKVKFSFHEKMEEVIDKSDILYMTRLQKERFLEPMEYERLKGVYILTLKHLEKVKANFKVLHALPRVNEIDLKVDATPYAYYFQQAQNGLLVRQTLLNLVLNKN